MQRTPTLNKRVARALPETKLFNARKAAWHVHTHTISLMTSHFAPKKFSSPSNKKIEIQFTIARTGIVVAQTSSMTTATRVWKIEAPRKM